MSWPSTISFFARMYPFYSGYGAIANHRLMKRWLSASSELVWAKSPGGDLRVPLDDYLGRAVYLFGDLDPKVTWVLRQVLKPGDIVFDVGANLGLLSLLTAKLVGPAGHIHAFEPNPELCRLFEATVLHNSLTNVTLHPFALGASEGSLNLHIPTSNSGAASLIHTSRPDTYVRSVPVKRLDDVTFQEPILKIALLKIDVEGFELEVLKGAQRILENIHPETILFESNQPGDSNGVTPVMQLLHDHGYEFVSIPRRLVRMTTQVVDLKRPGKPIGHDLVAAPRGSKFERLCALLKAR